MFKQIVYFTFSVMMSIGFIGCGGSSSNELSNDVTKITKSSISGKTFKIKNLSSSKIFTVRFNGDLTITALSGHVDLPFDEDNRWQVSKTGELKTSYSLLGTVLTVTTHKQTDYKNGCYIVHSTQTNSNWNESYELCTKISINRPTLTSQPTSTTEDSVEVEVNGKVGMRVFVNGVDSGSVIDSNGKTIVNLDTSGLEGDKHFSISLKDDIGHESEVLSLIISKVSSVNNSNVSTNLIKKMIVVSGIYNDKNDWSQDFYDIEVANVYQWAEMKQTISFNTKMIIDLGLESGSKEDKSKHKNPSSILLRWWVKNRAYLQLDFRDKNSYLLHTFKFIKNEGHNSAYI